MITVQSSKRAAFRQRRLRRQRGLTLIELLVTMVLLGFIVALMSGAFVQIAQMLRISSEHGNGFASRWTQSRALQDMVANLAADPELPNPLEGTAARIQLTTLALPPAASGTPQRATLELKTSGYSADADITTVLQVAGTPVSFGAAEVKPFELARYRGRLVFVYLDATGKESRQWPPLGATQLNKLPSAIGLRDEAKQSALVQLAYYEGLTAAKIGGTLSGMFGGAQ